MSPWAILPAAVGGGLVRDLPDAVDPQQIVEVEPFVGPALEAELDRGSIAHLRHRDKPTHDATTWRRSPPFEALGNQVFVQAAFRIDEEDPGVFVKSLLELANIIVIESIDVEFYNTNDLVVVSCSCGHLDLPFAGLFAVVSRVDRGERLKFNINPMAAATPSRPSDRRLVNGAS